MPSFKNLNESRIGLVKQGRRDDEGHIEKFITSVSSGLEKESEQT